MIIIMVFCDNYQSGGSDFGLLNKKSEIPLNDTVVVKRTILLSRKKSPENPIFAPRNSKVSEVASQAGKPKPTTFNFHNLFLKHASNRDNP